MKYLALISAGRRSVLSLVRSQHLASSIARSASSTARKKFDFKQIDSNWGAKWATRGGRGHDGGDPTSDCHSLAPIYWKHVQKPTILQELMWRNTKRASAVAFPNSGKVIYDRVLELGNYDRDCKDHKGFFKDGMNMQQAVDKYGSDIVRTHMVFHSEIAKDPSYSDDDGIVQTHFWFESIWKAILLVHEAFDGSQVSTREGPAIPEAFYEANLETWLDYVSDGSRELVLVRPDEPNILQSDMEEHDVQAWLAAQEAIFSVIQPLGGENTLHNIEARLVSLTKEIINYNDAWRQTAAISYHSARILLCLIAPLAPAFAEECWVVLHYGTNNSSNGKDADDGWSDSSIDEMLNHEAEEFEDLRHLPRKGRPHTLWSIFDEPFPDLVTKETLALLRSPSLLAQARTKADAVKEKWAKRFEEVTRSTFDQFKAGGDK